MPSRAKFWICINVYALLLDGLGLSAFTLAFVLFGTWPVTALIVSLGGAFLVYGGLGIHSTYSEKCRIYSVLIRRNAHQLRKETFRDFMEVPCHRIIVRMALHRVGCDREYYAIKKEYYVPPWRRSFGDETKLFVFKTKEEGDRWLLQQNNKLS